MWQSMATAPKDGTSVLLWCTDVDGRNGRVSFGTWHDFFGGTWWDWSMEYTLSHPTHWMPLPDPPTVEAK